MILPKDVLETKDIRKWHEIIGYFHKDKIGLDLALFQEWLRREKHTFKFLNRTRQKAYESSLLLKDRSCY